MDEDKMMEQGPVAETVAGKIPYTFIDAFLVKPLDPIKVKKEFSKPVEKSEEATTDKNGVTAKDFDEVETEVKEVNSDYRKGVVLKVPFAYRRVHHENDKDAGDFEIQVGDVILFREAGAKYFDLLKDSMLVNYFNIVAIEK